MFIDTHTHYYDEAFGQEGDAAVERAVEAGVGLMLQADVDSRERDAMFRIGHRHPKHLRQMLGLYPGSVDAGWKDEIDALLPWFDKEKAVAVGEIGLDYHEGKEFIREQKEALRVQFELAAEKDLPVNIHLRDATADFIAAVRDAAHLHLRGNLHCFGLSIEAYREVCRYGEWSVGIGGVVTFKNSGLAQTVARIPLDRILLETDCPYLAPVPYRGHRNESAYIPLIAAKVAEIKGVSVEQVEAVTTENARKLFRL